MDPERPVADTFSALGGWTVVVVLAVAPMLTGTRLPWSIRAVEWAVLAAAALRAAGAIAAGRWVPAVPVLPGVLLGLLLLQGWVLTSVPRSEFEPGGGRLVVTPAEVGGPAVGTVDQRASIEAMWRTTAVAAVFVACCGMVRDGPWTARLLAGVAAGGVGVVTLGLLAKAGVVVELLEPASRQDGPVPFGPFAYHGNAGAFLNVAVSAAVGGAVVARRLAVRVGCAVAAAAGVAGAFVNVSKAGQALTAVTLAAWAMWWATSNGPKIRRVVVAACLVTVVAVGGVTARARWHGLRSELAADGPRQTLWRICFGLARSAGPLGYGPGSFKLLLPHAAGIESLYARYIVTLYRPGAAVSMWSNAHDDLLQAAIEWGWLGAAGWAALVVGGVSRGASRWREGEMAAAVIAVGVTCVHSLGDFPFQVFCVAIDVSVLSAVLWAGGRGGRPVREGRGFDVRVAGV